MARAKRDPRTKEEFLDRILRFDFTGDIREIGAEAASIVRTGPNSLKLTFPVSGQTFELTVHKPRGEQYQARQVAGEGRSFSDGDGGPRIEAAPEEHKPSRRQKATPGRRQAPGRQQQA